MSNQVMNVKKYCFRLAIGLGVLSGVGCGVEPPEPAPTKDVTRADEVLSSGPSLSSVSPIQDPSQCVLPSGRYVVSAAVTNTPNVYNVTFHNDGADGSFPSARCKTMRMVWDEGVPYPSHPPQPPAEADFPKRLLEGWWQETAVPKRFAVKAVWRTDDNLGVITGIAGAPASGYYVIWADIFNGWRFNWTASPTADHTRYLPYFPLWANQELLITDPQTTATYQSLSCLSGTTRLADGYAMNCPLPDPWVAD